MNLTGAGARVAFEQPLFTSRAHVFQIDPVSKKSWLPASKQAVAVSFFFDNTRNSFRIISVDGSKAIINSIITTNMMFTKTSQKFGQWADSRANTVYGLGFGSEAELNKFVEKFNELKEAALAGGTDKKAAGEGKPLPNGVQEKETNGSPRNHARQPSGDASNPGVPILSTSDSQLKYENDRLKIALAQSSNNAKKWEAELQTLKNNNARLTTALQESTTNVEEWQKQLKLYKEDNTRLKLKIQELEGHVSDNPGSGSSDMEQRLSAMRVSHQAKEQEVTDLTRKLQDTLHIKQDNSRLQGELEELRQSKESLTAQVSELQAKVTATSEGKRVTSEQFQQLHSQLGNTLQQLNTIHQQMAKNAAIDI
ncbi:putative homer protein-like 2 isoform X2 [Apostichopus japonicus]|uniref:Putative homer protein-like 2 isoform X2 n=1 Tax=Stichopus japonicus TaxID=307972 RepID=A0A2G8JPH8_STIJA|nr:putative homer protein-like 2 isoform X2 [Apostichopus japonicus]